MGIACIGYTRCATVCSSLWWRGVKEGCSCLQEETPTALVCLFSPQHLISTRLFVSALRRCGAAVSVRPDWRGLALPDWIQLLWKCSEGARQFALLNNLYSRQSAEEIEQSILKRHSFNTWSMYRSFSSTRQRLMKTWCRLSRKGA